MPAPADRTRLNSLITGRSWIDTWTRAANDATRRLHVAYASGDNEAGLIAAHESLTAVDRLIGWALHLTKLCDDSYRAKVREFQEAHPDLRRARNLHEHPQGYLSHPRDVRADSQLTGAVAYQFTDEGSFRIELVTATSSDTVDVELTAAIADSLVLAWETTKAVDRAIDGLVRKPGDEAVDVDYFHAIQREDGSFYFSNDPPDGYDR